MQKNLRLKF